MTVERRLRGETTPLGASDILAQHLHAAQNKAKGAPAPLVHTVNGRARREFYRMYAVFVGAF